MRFRDRQEAGQLLAQALTFVKGEKDVIVLGIPRGGVVVAAEVAWAIGAPLDVYITRKIGAPCNPELAIGAIASSGDVVLDKALMTSLGVSPEYVQDETERQRREIERRLRKYRGNRPAQKLEGKTILLVDDGIATGATTLAAIRALKKQKPAELILAVPVGPPDTVARLREEVDKLVCLDTPHLFWAVGAFYVVFDQTSDEEVVRLLEGSQGGTKRAIG
ncbi:MAG: phosphoribosyltransferase family protein [Anaerolineae bacterium]